MARTLHITWLAFLLTVSLGPLSIGWLSYGPNILAQEPYYRQTQQRRMDTGPTELSEAVRLVQLDLANFERKSSEERSTMLARVAVLEYQGQETLFLTRGVTIAIVGQLAMALFKTLSARSKRNGDSDDV